MGLCCLFEVDRHSPLGRDHQVIVQNHSKTLHLWFFIPVFPETLITLKNDPKRTKIELIFTEDGELYNDLISYFLNKLCLRISQHSELGTFCCPVNSNFKAASKKAKMSQEHQSLL